MDKTLLISSSGLEGNVGSCSTEVVEARTDFFHQTVVFTNSCSGEIVQKETYFDYSLVLFAGVMLIVTLFSYLLLRD